LALKIRSRKSERGTTVLIVVMVTTLITAIGVFAVRNIAEIDRAVGYGRQAAQTTALAELGTTAAMAQIAATGTSYQVEMSKIDELAAGTSNPTKPKYKCWANRPFETTGGSTCFPILQERIEGFTTTNNGETLLEPPVAGAESGSFGALSQLSGTINAELTEKRNTGVPTPGNAGSSIDVTLTTTAMVSPTQAGSDPCANGAATVAVKKVMRAHVILPPDPQ
jgi:hypothetical protein